MKEFNVLFVGGIFPKDMEKEVIKKSRNNIQLAANNFQWDLINGFDQNLNKPVTILNEMFIGSYPNNYKSWFIKEKKFSHTKGSKDINLGFINFTFLKQFLHPFNYKKHIKEWLSLHPENKAVFIYSLDIRFVRISRFIKKISPETPIIVSVMDLPEHVMKSKKNTLLMKMWKKYFVKKVNKGLNLVDGCMVLTRKQIERLPKKESDCIVIEAITNSKNRDYLPLKENNKKRILYAGTLAKQYNIHNLLNAFMQLPDPDVQLDICGDGETKEDILNASKIDPRIKYHGVITKSEVNSLMRESRILINPRESGQDYTGYSFPSKTIDYLMSGRPVICQKLEGIPDEYDDQLIYFESSTNDTDLLNKLRLVLDYNLDKVNDIGRKNFLFAAEEKSSVKQIVKILELFERKQKELL